MSTTQSEFDVVIVGCGPTGATLANLLGLSGLSVLVLERELDMYDLPRAVHFDDETMRVFQTVGIAKVLEEKVRINPGMRFVGENDQLILDWPRPAEISKHGWHSSYRLHQPDLEILLRSALKKRSNCSLELGKTVVDLSQQSSCVEVSYQDAESEKMRTITTRYVVGCDGANSTVRNFIQSKMEDLGFNERWLVVDVLLKHDLPRLGDYTIQYCDAAQAMTYCRNPGLRRRWEMALPDSMTDEDAGNEDRIWSLLARWISKDNASLERKAIYTFRSALAKTWRHKRLLIAGDAAHLTPPFMGQGMCTGIRDAANLAWKLAQCIRGQASSELLDSYQQERSPHAREYINTAMHLGKMMTSIDRSHNSHSGSSPTPNPPKMASLSPKLGESFLSGCNATGCTNSGVLFSQPELLDGSLLDDYCGYQPVLLVRQDSDKQYANSSKIKCLSGDEHPQLAKALSTCETKAILLRPDRYILASAASEKEIRGLINLSNKYWPD